jgi:hypothetical protein
MESTEIWNYPAMFIFSTKINVLGVYQIFSISIGRGWEAQYSLDGVDGFLNLAIETLFVIDNKNLVMTYVGCL